MKKSATAAEKRHLDRVAKLGTCAVCGDFADLEVHHIREGQGMSERASHFLTIPLCFDCHRGKDGIHGTRNLWKIYKMDELDALADTIRRLEE
jgi:5-methylcytosine-specific restriction endonuclease McrA